MKKRIFIIMIAAVMLSGLLSTVVSSADSTTVGGTWGGIDWTLDADGTLTIAPTSGTPVPDASGKWTYEVGEWREAVIYNSKGVASSIGGWPYDRTAVKRLVIEEGVTSIGSFAVQSFTNLTGEVVIPSTVTYIGQEAFQKSTMTKLTFAKGGTEELCIAQGAFKNLIIEEIALPDDRPVHLHAWAFLNSTKLKSITFPDTLKSITGTNHVDYNHNPSAQTGGNSGTSTLIDSSNKNLKTINFGSEAVQAMFTSKGYSLSKYEVAVDYHTHCTCGGSVTEGGHVCDAELPNWTPWNGTSEITYTDGVARVYLLWNASRNTALTVPAGNTLYLCLNGYDLEYTGAEDSSVIVVETDANLNLTDCIGGGSITGGIGTTADDSTLPGGGIKNLGTLNMYAGNISGNKGYGGGVVNYGTFTMYGGSITGNTAYNGGGIMNDGIVTVNSGTIANNTAVWEGGGIYSSNLSGDNVLHISGAPTICGNEVDGALEDIHLEDGMIIDVGNNFAPTEPIYITASSVFGAIVESENITNDMQYFVSGDQLPQYIVDNQLYVGYYVAEEPSVKNAFSVTMSGEGNFVYQWYTYAPVTMALRSAGTKIPVGGTNTTLDIDNIDFGTYFCEITWNQGESNEYVMRSANVDYTAYLVTLNYGELLDTPDRMSADPGTVLTPTPRVFGGYVFMGWYADSGFTTRVDDTISVNSNITLYARFVPAIEKAVEKIERPDDTKPEYVITYTDGTTETIILENGEDGKTPTFKIESGNLFISYDNGTSWTDLGSIKGEQGPVGPQGPQGEQGEQGPTGPQGEAGVDGKTPSFKMENGELLVSYDDGVTWSSLGNVEGEDGTNGITPQLRVNPETNEWEVSYDEGTTWTSMGVKATADESEITKANKNMINTTAIVISALALLGFIIFAVSVSVTHPHEKGKYMDRFLK